MSETIAFVGLGTMGLPMAENLVKRQLRVVGYDVRPAAMACSTMALVSRSMVWNSFSSLASVGKNS